MTASRATNPSDNIVTDVQSQKDVDFRHITKEIEDYHRSHPKSFQQELGRINQAVQNNPTLHAAIPDLTIVGAKGQDLTFKDKDGHFVTVDSKNINRRTMAPQSPEIQDFGRTGSADMMLDGSGRFTVPKHGRVDGWDMAREVLKSQTGQEPSLNEIGNYLVEAKRLNPHTNFNRPLKSGSTIDLPSVTRQGDETTFGDQRSVDDQQHARLEQDNTDAQGKRTDAGKVKQAYDNYAKYYQTLMGGTKLDGLDQKSFGDILAPGHNPLPPDTKQSLEYLRDNWDKIQDMTEPVNGTRALTENSVQAGLKARALKAASAQAALDQQQAKDQTIIPQSQWAADHGGPPAPVVRRETPDRDVAPQVIPPLTSPTREITARKPDGDTLPEGFNRNAPIVPNVVRTVPAPPYNPKGEPRRPEAEPPQVATREPGLEEQRFPPNRPETVTPQETAPRPEAQKIEKKYQDLVAREQKIRNVLGPAFESYQRAGGSAVMTEQGIDTALQTPGLSQDDINRLKDVKTNWKSLQPYTVGGKGQELSLQSTDDAIQNKKTEWAAKKEQELQSLPPPSQQRSDIGNRPPGISDEVWDTIKSAKVIDTWHDVKGTGYQPVSGQGGPLDSARRPVHTIEDVERGKAPFVTLAFDSSLNIPYGQIVYNKKGGWYGIAADNGDHFNGRTGQSAVDIAARGSERAHSNALNASDLELEFLDARAPYEEPVPQPQRHRRGGRHYAGR